MPPKLFTAVLECAFKKLNWDKAVINIGGKLLSNLRFVDDIVLNANDLHKAEVMLNELAGATNEVGLQINKSKTNFMTNLVTGGTMKLENNIIDDVTQYRYLGHELRITRDNQTQGIHRRIGLGWTAYGKLRDVFNSEILMRLKRKVYNQFLLPVERMGPKHSSSHCTVFLRRLAIQLAIITRDAAALKISDDVLLSHRRRSLIQEFCLLPLDSIDLFP